LRMKNGLRVKDIMIFLLLMTMFVIFYPLVFMTVYEMKNGERFVEVFSDNFWGGVFIDIFIIFCIILVFVNRGKCTDERMYMTFGGSRKRYYKQHTRKLLKETLVLSLVRSIYIFALNINLPDYLVVNDNSTEVEYEKQLIAGHPDVGYPLSDYVRVSKIVLDPDKVSVSFIYILIQSIFIFSLIFLAKEILESIFTGKRIVFEGIRGNETVARTVKSTVRNIFIFLLLAVSVPVAFESYYFIDTWYSGLLDYATGFNGEMYYFYEGYGGLKNLPKWVSGYADYYLFSPKERVSFLWSLPLEIILPDGTRMSLGNLGRWVYGIMMVMIIVILFMIYRRSVMRKQDRIEG